jgi:hypothetical protein
MWANVSWPTSHLVSTCVRVVGFKSVQNLSLGKGCVRHGIVQHEMLHALGFEHEQGRTDRDKYVKINYNNIPPNCTCIGCMRCVYVQTNSRLI